MRQINIKPKINSKQQGFTLIEIIIGMVVFAISLTIIAQIIAPAEENSADQIHQIKAAELGQALMNDIMSRAFDEHSDRLGGIFRCDEDQNDDGTIDNSEKCSNVLGPDEDGRASYNDVDDFHGFNKLVGANGQPLHSGYNSFTLNVSVSYAGTDLGLANNVAKRIYIVVTTPLGTAIEFSAYKANF